MPETTRTCRGCDAVIEPGPRERRKREWCSGTCRARAIAPARQAAGLAYFPRSRVWYRDCAGCGHLYVARTSRGRLCLAPECSVMWKRNKANAFYAANREAELQRFRDLRAARTPQERQQHAATRKAWRTGKGKQPTVPCGWCGDDSGKVAMADRRVTCSDICRIAIAHGYWPKCDVPARHPSRPRPAPQPRLRPRQVWASGPCAHCGEQFTAGMWPGAHVPRYCSDRCDQRAASARHKSRQYGGHRERIYARDGYRCHLCRKPMAMDQRVPHPLAPTLDHLVPRVHGGTNDPANLASAHFLCNSIKGDRGGGEQLALVG